MDGDATSGGLLPFAEPRGVPFMLREPPVTIKAYAKTPKTDATIQESLRHLRSRHGYSPSRARRKEQPVLVSGL